MASAWVQLGGRRRTIARTVYARDSSTPGYVCPKCGKPIDWTLPYRDHYGRVNLYCKSVDHGDELQDGGALTDLSNLVSTHLTCNSSKGAARRWERTRPHARDTTTIAIDPRTL